MKKIILQSAFILVASFNILFCNAQWIHTDDRNGIKIIYAFDLTVQQGDSSLSLNLTVEDRNENKTINYGNIQA